MRSDLWYCDPVFLLCTFRTCCVVQHMTINPDIRIEGSHPSRLILEGTCRWVGLRGYLGQAPITHIESPICNTASREQALHLRLTVRHCHILSLSFSKSVFLIRSLRSLSLSADWTRRFSSYTKSRQVEKTNHRKSLSVVISWPLRAHRDCLDRQAEHDLRLFRFPPLRIAVAIYPATTVRW